MGVLIDMRMRMFRACVPTILVHKHFVRRQRTLASRYQTLSRMTQRPLRLNVMKGKKIRRSYFSLGGLRLISRDSKSSKEQEERSSEQVMDLQGSPQILESRLSAASLPSQNPPSVHFSFL